MPDSVCFRFRGTDTPLTIEYGHDDALRILDCPGGIEDLRAFVQSEIEAFAAEQSPYAQGAMAAAVVAKTHEWFGVLPGSITAFGDDDSVWIPNVVITIDPRGDLGGKVGP